MQVQKLSRTESRTTVDSVLCKAFAQIDTDNNGEISALDLKQGLEKVGVKLTLSESLELLEKIDKTRCGKITFEDFKLLHETFIDDIFKSFDVDNSGYIDASDLQTALPKLGVAITNVEAQDMIRELNPQELGKLRKEDFRELYLVLRATMFESKNFEAFLWDPDVRALSKRWWKSSVEVESGLRIPLPETKKSVDPSIRFFGGALSGIIEALFLTPLDVTKTRLQLDHSGVYRGMLDCGKNLYRSEGFLGLYKGFTPWTTHVVVKNGSRFYFNALYRKLLATPDGQVTSGMEFLAGAMAGATEAIMIVTPFEVVKTRLQAQNVANVAQPKYSGPIQAASLIVRNEGIFGLWKGVAPTIVRQGLNQACSFWTNNAIKKHVWEVSEGQSLAPWKSVLTGMLGAIPGPLLNCPADVIKTRLMNQENARNETPKYRGFIHAFTKISREEGFPALYKGLTPRLTRLCPSYGIQWLVMDQFTAYFG